MIDGIPSRTGLFVAQVRSLMERPHSEQGDPSSQARLCGEVPDSSLVALPQAQNILARTPRVDAAVSEAISGGVSQIVIVGAGYDDRALRFKTPGVRFFEVDHPATQADKSLRLDRMGADSDDLVLVPCDLRRDDAGELLSGHGHDSAIPTLFICEGLLVYFDPAENVSILSSLRGRAEDGGELVATCAIHPPGISGATFLEVANARRRTGESEPWKTILELDAHLELVRSAGWVVEEVSDLRPGTPGESDLSHESRGGSVLVTARPG